MSGLGESSLTPCVSDILDWIHAITNQIPDRGQHLTRYYGWYASWTRSRIKARTSPTTTPTDTPAEDEGEPAFTTARRASWARLLRKLFEVDPLLCPRCGDALAIVAVITEPPRPARERSQRGEPRLPCRIR